MCTCASAHATVRGQLARVGSLPPSRGSLGLVASAFIHGAISLTLNSNLDSTLKMVSCLTFFLLPSFQGDCGGSGCGKCDCHGVKGQKVRAHSS